MIPIPTSPLRLLLAFGLISTLLACNNNTALQTYRASIPARIETAQWTSLVPLANFAPLRPLIVMPDPRSLAARAAGLRAKARAIQGPVVTPQRRRAMHAALNRYFYNR